jgi:hypothetical protein
MDNEVERLITTSFLLGLRVSQSINNLPPPDRIRYAALVESLQGIAAGEELPLDGGADLKRMRTELVDLDAIQRDYNSQQKRIAATVLQRVYTSPKG